MTPSVFLLLTLAGGVGAVARYLVDVSLRGRWTGLPWSTAVINLTGSLALGFLAGLADVDLVSSAWTFVLGTGFLGGYTTFSTASLENVTLIRAGRPGQALLHGLGTLVACVGLAALGLWVGSHA